MGKDAQGQERNEVVGAICCDHKEYATLMGNKVDGCYPSIFFYLTLHNVQAGVEVIIMIDPTP